MVSGHGLYSLLFYDSYDLVGVYFKSYNYISKNDISRNAFTRILFSNTCLVSTLVSQGMYIKFV